MGKSNNERPDKELSPKMRNLIPNSTLSIEHLPEPTDAGAVFKFAMSFDGYEIFGSFAAAAENAGARKRESLTDLRNELFMRARASKLTDDNSFLACYRELLPLLKQAILSRKQGAIGDGV
jgi:hypothetical protein